MQQQQPAEGEISLLVVNVGGPDFVPPSTNAQLFDDWFLDNASLGTQIGECSAGKLIVTPRIGQDFPNGVLTVPFATNVSTSYAVAFEQSLIQKCLACLPNCFSFRIS